MAINRKLGYNTQNWDAEPDLQSTQAVALENLPKVGDLVGVKHSYSLVPHPKHSEYMHAAQLYEREAKKVLSVTNGRHAVVIGDMSFTTGIYMGEVHLNEGRKMMTGNHWTSVRNVDGLVRIFHSFLFGSYKVLLQLNEVEVIQHVDNDDLEDDE